MLSDGFYKALLFFPICNLRGEEREYSREDGPALFLPPVGVVLENAAFALALPYSTRQYF